MTNATLQSWARALGGEVSGAQVLCPGPGHSAEDRSLSVTIGRDGEPIVHSFSGDDWKLCRDYVRSRLGMEPFKPQAKTSKHERARQPKKTYFDYRDETGAILYQVERTDYYDGRKKTLYPRRPDGNGGWITGKGCMAGVPRVPYRLPELIEAVANGNLIVIVEGESKVDLLRSWNVPATCNSGGSGSAKIWAEHAAYFHDANVIILPDNDETGRKHANAVAAFLKKVNARVRIIDLPGLPPKGDVVDWAAAGGTAERMHGLIEKSAAPMIEGVSLDDFNAYMPTHSYIFTPSREMWPAASVNARISAGLRQWSKTGVSQHVARQKQVC